MQYKNLQNNHGNVYFPLVIYWVDVKRAKVERQFVSRFAHIHTHRLIMSYNTHTHTHMYIHMHARIHTYIHMHHTLEKIMHTHTCAHIHARTHTHKHTRAHANHTLKKIMHKHTQTYTCTIHTHTQKYTHTHTLPTFSTSRATRRYSKGRGQTWDPLSCPRLAPASGAASADDSSCNPLSSAWPRPG